MSPAASKFLPYLARYRRRFAAGAVFLVLATGIQLLTPWVLKYAIDDLAVGLTSSGATTDDRTLVFYAGVIVGIALAAGGCRFLTRRIIIGASREIEYDLRNDFFGHLQRLPLAYFQASRTGDLMSRATNDLAAVRMMAGPAVMYTATTSITFVSALVLMLSISPSLTVLALLPLPIVSIVVKHFGAAIYLRSERIQAQLADLSAVVQEALAGARVVRAYRREEVEIERFRAANLEYVDRSRAMIRLQGVFHPSMALFLGLSALVVLWIGSQQVINGRITVGEFVAFNGYVVMLSWPMIAFGWVTNILQRGMAAWRRMLDVLDVEPTIRDSEPHSTITSSADVRGQVEFRDLTFAYNGREVLSNVSARVEPGQVLALVGPTGSGKTTLVDLVPRLFEPPPGTVFLDGVDVRHLPLGVLRGAIGYAPQEPFLFSATVADNVAFGVPAEESASSMPPVVSVDADDVRRAVGPPAAIGVDDALDVARLEGDLQCFPRGLDTAVGERGITLSGGQKQRVALARALLVDPRVLILDDALSAVDTHTENTILSRLRTVMRQRTAIVVAHRISTVRDADLILVLDDGRVVERGTHDELVALGGLYAGLHQKQLLEEELEGS